LSSSYIAICHQINQQRNSFSIERGREKGRKGEREKGRKGEREKGRKGEREKE
jgi:hypothetical protein